MAVSSHRRDKQASGEGRKESPGKWPIIGFQMDKEIILENGKYRFHMDEGTLQCERYGERWRDFIGDNAVSFLFDECLGMKHQLKAIKDELNFLINRLK